MKFEAVFERRRKSGPVDVQLVEEPTSIFVSALVYRSFYFANLCSSDFPKVSVAGSRSYRDETSTIKTVSSFAEKQITPPATSAFFGNLQAFLHYTVSVRINTTVGIGQRTVANFKTNSAGKSIHPKSLQHITFL